jgi:hypothetical protein
MWYTLNCLASSLANSKFSGFIAVTILTLAIFFLSAVLRNSNNELESVGSDFESWLK